MTISNGICVETRERVFIEDDPDLVREFFQEVKATNSGKKYFAEYYSRENTERVISAVSKLHPNAEYITVAMFVDAIATSIAAGELTPTHEPEAPIPVVAPTPVPVDRNGRPLSAAQIQWGEFVRWSETASSAERKERIRTEPAYGAFVQTNLRREIETVGDGLVEQNPHLVPQKPPSQAALVDKRLMKFASEYRNTPTAEIRRLKRLDCNPLGAAQFNKDEADCFRLNLL